MKTLAKIIATAAALGLLAPVALAERGQQPETRDQGSGSTTIGQEERGEEQSVEQQEQGRSTSTARQGGEDNATTTGEREREQHRSQVADQVQALLRAADRDSDIGDEVREVAHEVASSSERVDEDTAKVDQRPGWMTFLIGADFRNLGALRSEVATTKNHIERLTKARARATDASTTATLDAQIQALAESASSTEAFVRSHESAFSIFGWFFKLFS
jgi:hypothetical protein